MASWAREPEVDCCIVGAGPAGAMLGLLMARQGLRVVLLEAANDFDREFRGDTLHPSVMEILDEIGLADRVLALPHQKIRRGTGETPSGIIPFYDFADLKTRFPFITMLPQASFLELITREACRYSGFEIRMGARVGGLIRDPYASVLGVRYGHKGDSREVRARLTVGCDGRGSALRRLAGIEPVGKSAPMDILWFRVPRNPDRGPGGFRTLIGGGQLLVLVDRGPYWQVGCVIPKGGYGAVHQRGLARFREALEDRVAEFRGHLGGLTSWDEISVLSVQSMSLPRWTRPGLLLIGDAAHVMSPVGGAGINIAIQDAVVAAARLAGPLIRGNLEEAHLIDVERRRRLAVCIVQAFQSVVEKLLVSAAIERGRLFWLPLLLRLPAIRTLPTRLVAFGPWRVHVAPR